MEEIKKHKYLLKLNESTKEKLEKFCQENGCLQSATVDKILASFLDDYFSKSEEERKLIK